MSQVERLKSERHRIAAIIQRLPQELRMAELDRQIDQLDPSIQEYRDVIRQFTSLGLDCAPPPVTPHIVVLIHGIRTQADWGEMVASVLEPHGLRVIPIRYGFFDLIKFVCPVATRRRPIGRIYRELKDIRAENPTAKISVIAHSFGTYALTKVLKNPEIRLFRVILCGCIIPESFRKMDFRGQLSDDHILNDCGTHDIWPIMARICSWGYGATGTFGFGTQGVHDRYNKFGHGDYFDRTFVETYWVPYLSEGKILRTEWEVIRSSSPYHYSILAQFPLKTAAFTLIIVVAGAIALLFR